MQSNNTEKIRRKPKVKPYKMDSFDKKRGLQATLPDRIRAALVVHAD